MCSTVGLSERNYIHATIKNDLYNGYRVSVWDEKIQEMVGGDCCVTMGMYITSLKIAKMVKCYAMYISPQ